MLAAGAAILPLLAVAPAARAADIPRPVHKSAPSPVAAIHNWTGFYAGINGGSGFDTSNWAVNAVTIRSRGALIGGTVGYNHQLGRMVHGIETDLDWANAKGAAPCGAFSCETKNTWLGTIRARTGYAFDRWLPYVTFGLAYGNIEASSTDPTMPGASKTRIGWVAGGGLEYAFARNWSAKFEYLYLCLGRVDQGDPCTTSLLANNISLKESVVRAGVNYKFSGPPW